jgi:micrococcal nuclease
MVAAPSFAAIAGCLVIALTALAKTPDPPEPQAPPLTHAPAVAGPARQLIPVEVLRVIDGDTVEVRARIWLDQFVVTRLRLRGIDAPERGGRCAAEAERAEAARRRLAALAGEDAGAFLTDLGTDKYGGRVLGRLVGADGRDLGARMVADGHARPYDGRRRQAWC